MFDFLIVPHLPRFRNTFFENYSKKRKKISTVAQKRMKNIQTKVGLYPL